MNTRKVSIFTTKGQNRTGARALVIPTEVTTLSQLFGYFDDEDVAYFGMKIMLVENNSTLESPDATLPVGDFMLSFTPLSTKAGAPDYNTMKTYIKEARAEAAANKNTVVVTRIGDYTRLTKMEMHDLYESLQQVEDEGVVAIFNNEDVTAEVQRLKKRINELIDDYNMDDEEYEDLDEEIATYTREEEIPEAVLKLQKFALGN